MDGKAIAYDSGVRVIVETDLTPDADPLLLTIADTEIESIGLSELEAERLIDALQKGLATLRQRRRPDRD